MLEVAKIGGSDSDLERSRLQLVHELTCAAGQVSERLELRVEPREQLFGLEAALALPQHHFESVLLEQCDRVELRMQDACNRVGLRERLADVLERRRKTVAVLGGDGL